MTDDTHWRRILDEKNVGVLKWATFIFVPIYASWTFFDWLLAPAQWSYFLVLRLGSVVAGFTSYALVTRSRAANRHIIGFWVLFFIWGAFVAPMLPKTGEAFLPYTLGLCIVIFGAAAMPYWSPVWTTSNLLAIAVAVVASFLIWPSNIPTLDLITAAFFVTSVMAVSVFAAMFKYEVTKKEILAQLALREEQQTSERLREAERNRASELASALERLKDLDELKSRFFANISHELRTPLTLILAPVQKLASEPTLNEHRGDLEIIARNAQRLLRLIDDLLDLNKLDAGGLRLNLAEVDLEQVTRSVFENSRPAALIRSMDFVFEPEPCSHTVLADAHRLEIVLTNLISNALKYTPDGGRIVVRIEELSKGVQVSVEDSGKGIPSEQLNHIFERFYQVQEGTRRNAGGVGIGLALAHELIDLHGGTLAVESEPERGTTFRFVLPFGEGHVDPDVVERRRGIAERRGELRPGAHPGRRAADVSPPDTVPHDPAHPAREIPATTGTGMPILFEGSRRARIVLVEDQDDLRQFVADLLEREFEVTTASDGEEGWERVQKEAPDLVVSDVMMPKLSGTELCQAIKADPHLGATPVILLTARVGSEATLEAYAHGADDFVAKPFHPRVLLARVRAQLRLRALGLELAEREKLAVVGTMAAGILHEVRNPVNAILAASGVLAAGKAAPDKAARLIDVVRDGAQRIQEITSAIDTHARPADGDTKIPCDLQAGLESTLRLLEHRLGEIEIHRDYRSSHQPLGIPGRLNQVLLNLVDNALNAGARTLWLTVTHGEGLVHTCIADDGPGVSPEIVQRVFDPFFTTADVGGGTGLGLYLCRNMIEEMGGRIWFEPRDGGGTRFSIELPEIDETRAG